MRIFLIQAIFSTLSPAIIFMSLNVICDRRDVGQDRFHFTPVLQRISDLIQPCHLQLTIFQGNNSLSIENSEAAGDFEIVADYIHNKAISPTSIFIDNSLKHNLSKLQSKVLQITKMKCLVTVYLLID